MSIPPPVFAEAFREKRLGLVTMAVMTALVYLACLTMTAEVSFARILSLRGEDLGARLTVQVPTVPEEAEAQKAERVRQVTAALLEMKDIEQVTLVPEDESERLLSPWISDPEILKTLPIPTLIDLHSAPGKELKANEVKQRLEGISKEISVDGPGEWLGSFMRVVKGLGVVSAILILLTALTLVVAVGLICRVGFGMQHKTIELLHVLGATDRAIAIAFQRQLFRLAWPAAALGAFLAGASALGLVSLFHNLGHIPFVFSMSWGLPFVVMLIVPIIAVLGATYLTRLFVLRFLRRCA